MNPPKSQGLQRSGRLGYLDWMRGLAVLIMLQGHVFDGWVRPQDRLGERFWLSQFLGGLPAPIFLFLVGVSLTLVIDKLRTKQAPAFEIAKTVLRRSCWILLLAYAFRLQQFLAWYPGPDWRDLLKVDTLNCIAACMGLLGLAALPAKSRRTSAAWMGVATVLLAFLTPFIYPLQTGAPWMVQSYFNGAGRSDYFSVVPWIVFAMAGMAFGWMLLDARERQAERRFFLTVAVIGIAAYSLGATMSMFEVFKYGYFDYSITSPYFFMVRLGLLLLILYGAYRWSLRRTADRWSPLRALGQASLVVYWIHIELVYGRAFHGWTRALYVSEAMLHLIWFIPSMLLLAVVSRRWRSAWTYASESVIDWFSPASEVRQES